MATPDDGNTWFVGGRNQGAGAFASAFFYRSSDDGATWTSISLPEGVDIIRDISFSSDGQYGIAVSLTHSRYIAHEPRPDGSSGVWSKLVNQGGLGLSTTEMYAEVDPL